MNIEMAYDGNSGMIFTIPIPVNRQHNEQGRTEVKYYRDLQGRYYLAADDKGHFYIDSRVPENSPLWCLLETQPEVVAEKKKIADYYIENGGLWHVFDPTIKRKLP